MTPVVYTFSTEEWLALPTRSAIDGVPVNQRSVQHFLESTVVFGAHDTRTTHAVLRIPAMAKVKAAQHLLPMLLRWPDGKPTHPVLHGTGERTPQRVYFKDRFHCFDCGLTFPAFAISRDDYWLDGLQPPVVQHRMDAVGCPACDGPCRSPGLVEIFDTEQGSASGP
ncbi:hypothetical protein [Deinococcus enclensis]|uniref:Uncharacterized protein n=1 Tax=Deinococcus enclensis TaxID=1049582 RepID=A0ABT9MEV1_9DEIO|nr:hypothetical protein [Deinococcus enclensis]MDP9765127.1 hypothetical protein [Deinococcus enclensis]